jgi:hypothetical protein
VGKYATLDTVDRDQLNQLSHIHVWDGNLISKAARDRLVKYGLVDRVGGFNFLTKAGIISVVALGYLHHDDVGV